jgi:MATE family, multidrug efflux pump
MRELVWLSWPITLSTISYSLMTLVDTLLVGRLGAPQLAGVALGGTAAFTLLCFSFGLLRGVKTLVAQAVGAERHEEIGRYLGAALIAAAVIGAVTTALGQLEGLAVQAIAATPAEGAAAATYLRIRILAAPLALIYVALREVRYAQGDARTPMMATVAANVVNIALAYLFIFRLGHGVAGAAWATVIAQTVEAGIAALVQHLRGWRLHGMGARHLGQLWHIGWPTGVQFTLEVGAFAILTGLIAGLSEVQMAAHQIALQVIQFSFLPAFAVAEAASVLAGQAVGANRDDLVLRLSHLSLAIVGAYTGLCTLVLAVAAPVIVGGFSADAALAGQAVRLLYVAAVFQVGDGANIVARAILRGAGDVRFAAVVGVTTSWLFTPPLTWILGYRLHMGAFGGWLGFIAEIFTGAAILWYRLQRLGFTAAADDARARLRAIRAQARAPQAVLAA